MKLYEAERAPNPRRVRIFLAEKQLEVERINVDMRQGEHKKPAFLAKNPSGKLPVLELDDGRCLAESVAICRYLEAVRPEPNLFGRDAFELGRIEMANRQIELEFGVPLGQSWVNGPTIVQLFGPRDQLPLLRERADKQVLAFYRRLDSELGERQYMACDRFTIADITALCQIDFAMAVCDLKPADDMANLRDWHRRVRERPSATA